MTPHVYSPLPTAHRLRNERHKLLASGLRAGDGFEASAMAAAAYLKAKYGSVPIRDSEAHYISEIGLKQRKRE